jgi:2-polyprenyl-6-hydroxyphenyl methylase/3-demethylubiquinone-9 3-methyltransferase
MRAKTKKNPAETTVDASETARFSALAAEWWDPAGPMAPLHKLNPVRLDYLKNRITEHFKKRAAGEIRLLDIGCGGGLASEPLAEMGFQVTGVDASEELIEAAKAHARQAKRPPAYRCAAAETLAKEAQRFDVVLALEVIEHTADAQKFAELCVQLCEKNGLVIFSTLNRTPKAFALGIVGAEYILRWLPIGTHDWRKFVKPSELAGWLEKAGCAIKDVTGLVYSPISGSFSMNRRDVDVNYFLTGARSEQKIC